MSNKLSSITNDLNVGSFIGATLLELKLNGITPKGNVTLSMESHNISVTDNSSFFVKILGFINNVESFNMEVQASKAIPNTPKLLLPNMLNIYSRPATVWEYINGVTPSVDSLTEANIKAIMEQLNVIRTVPSFLFPAIKNLSQVAATVDRRLASEKALSMPLSLQKRIRVLADAFVVPLSQQSFKNSVICHSDVHVGNIMVLSDGSIQVVDFESLKLAPAELDLAGLYQNLAQSHNRYDLYQIAEAEFKKHNQLDEELLQRIILMRNISTTTYTVAFGDWDLVEERVSSLTKSLKTGIPPKYLRGF